MNVNVDEGLAWLGRMDEKGWLPKFVRQDEVVARRAVRHARSVRPPDPKRTWVQPNAPDALFGERGRSLEHAVKSICAEHIFRRQRLLEAKY